MAALDAIVCAADDKAAATAACVEDTRARFENTVERLWRTQRVVLYVYESFCSTPAHPGWRNLGASPYFLFFTVGHFITVARFPVASLAGHSAV